MKVSLQCLDHAQNKVKTEIREAVSSTNNNKCTLLTFQNSLQTKLIHITYNVNTVDEANAVYPVALICTTYPCLILSRWLWTEISGVFYYQIKNIDLLNSLDGFEKEINAQRPATQLLRTSGFFWLRRRTKRLRTQIWRASRVVHGKANKFISAKVANLIKSMLSTRSDKDLWSFASYREQISNISNLSLQTV